MQFIYKALAIFIIFTGLLFSCSSIQKEMPYTDIKSFIADKTKICEPFVNSENTRTLELINKIERKELANNRFYFYYFSTPFTQPINSFNQPVFLTDASTRAAEYYSTSNTDFQSGLQRTKIKDLRQEASVYYTLKNSSTCKYFIFIIWSIPSEKTL